MNKTVPIILLSLVFLSYNAVADVRLWVTNSSTDGDIQQSPTYSSGREGADAFCNADGNKPSVTNGQTIAFISTSASDEIRDIPTNYPAFPASQTIYRKDGTTPIVNNFVALFDNFTSTFTNSVDTSAVYAHTGTTFDGSTSSITNCQGYTSNSASDDSDSGLATSVDFGLFADTTNTCDASLRLFCLTFEPVTPASTTSDLSEWEEDDE